MLRWVFVKSSFSCVACWEKRLKHDRNRTDVHLCLIQLGHGPVLSNQYLIKYWNLHSLVAQGQGERRFDYGRVSIAALNKPHGGLGGIWLMFRDSTVLAQAISQEWTWTSRKRNRRDLGFETWRSIFKFGPYFLIWYNIPVRFVFRIYQASAISGRPRGTCESSCTSARREPGDTSAPCIVSDLCFLKPGSSLPEWPGLDNITSQPNPRRCKSSSVGQSAGLSIPRSSIWFRQK